MGMDVYGRKPKNKKGEYFRNNVWFWHPLWSYCEINYPVITSKCKEGHSNSGDGLNAGDAKKLAKLIEKDLANGRAAKYEKEYKEWQESLVKETCTVCSGSKIIKFKSSQDGVELEQERPCGNCDENGLAEPWGLNYPFSLDNLKEWQEFLDNCGGFNIH